MARLLDTPSHVVPRPSKCAARRRILVAGMGTSPAVLTNAVWTHAHQKMPVVPDEILIKDK